MVQIWWLLLYMILGCNTAPLVKRNSTSYVKVSLTYSSEESMYYIRGILIGTPPQVLDNVVLDTGSSDLVLSQPVFDSRKSTSFENTGSQYSIEYGSTGNIVMDMVLDKLGGTNWRISNYTFFIAEASNIDTFGGVMGIGYASLESSSQYPNIPIALKSEGLTHSLLYSIDGRGSSNNIIFGGIDKNAFVGPLFKIPIVYEVGPNTSRSYYNVLAITVNTIYVNGVVVSSEKLMYTIDSGSNALAVPEPILQNIASTLGPIKVIGNTSYYEQRYVDKAILTFDISGIYASILLSALIDETVYIEDTRYVSLLIVPVEIGIDSYEGTIPNAIFLNYYTVFDLDNNHIFLANYSSPTTEHIVAITDSSFAVLTAMAPNYKDIYTSMYEDDRETTICASPSFSSLVSSHTNTLSAFPTGKMHSKQESSNKSSRDAKYTTSKSFTHMSTKTSIATTTNTNKVCKIKS